LPSLQEIAAGSTGHQRAILSVGEYGMDTAIAVIESLLIQNHAQRIAATILRVAPTADGSQPNEHEDVYLTQSQLGEMASVGRQVVNRELQRLEAKGWIKVSYNRLKILNQNALAAFAQSGK